MDVEHQKPTAESRIGAWNRRMLRNPKPAQRFEPPGWSSRSWPRNIQRLGCCCRPDGRRIAGAVPTGRRRLVQFQSRHTASAHNMSGVMQRSSGPRCKEKEKSEATLNSLFRVGHGSCPGTTDTIQTVPWDCAFGPESRSTDVTSCRQSSLCLQAGFFVISLIPPLIRPCIRTRALRA